MDDRLSSGFQLRNKRMMRRKPPLFRLIRFLRNFGMAPMDYLAVALDVLAKLQAAPAVVTEPPAAEASTRGCDESLETPHPVDSAAPARAAPERFRPIAIDATRMTCYLSDTELAAWLNDSHQHPQDHGTIECSDGSPSALWDAAEVPGDGCPRCGSLASWWSIPGTQRCLACEPPRHDAEAIRAKAARIRKRTMKTQH